MATGTIPFSNPAGNNQTNPVNSIMPKPISQPAPTSIGAGEAGNNPYSVAPTAVGSPVQSTVPSGAPMTGVPNATGIVQSPANVAGTSGALNKQLVDIWGKGVGGALSNLLSGMSGTDSQVLQDYIKSLQPQMATASANTRAALGAGGVSANSSVSAIAEANLQAQETSAIAGESASLTKSQEDLTAQMLMGMAGPASQEVATSGWTTFGNVMGAIASDVGAVTSGSQAKTNFGAGSGSVGGVPASSVAGIGSMGPETTNPVLSGQFDANGNYIGG
jgi:hypothetical protein